MLISIIFLAQTSNKQNFIWRLEHTKLNSAKFIFQLIGAERFSSLNFSLLNGLHGICALTKPFSFSNKNLLLFPLFLFLLSNRKQREAAPSGSLYAVNSKHWGFSSQLFRCCNIYSRASAAVSLALLVRMRCEKENTLCLSTLLNAAARKEMW